MSTQNTSGCQDHILVTNIQNSTFLHITEVIMLVLSLVALPILLITLEKCIRCSCFHMNIRIITSVHCLCILLHCIGRIIQHSSDIYLWMAPLSTCDKRQFLEVCVISRSMYTFGIYGSSFTTVFMAIERTIATSLSRKYENKKTNLGIFLVLSQIILSLLITFFLFFSGAFPDRPVYCAFHSQKDWAVFVEIVTLSANFLALLQCYRLYNINMKLRTNYSKSDLSEKYQIEENKTLIRIIIRFTCLDFVFMVTYFLGTMLMETFDFKLSDGTLFAVHELIHCVPVYAIVVLFSMSKVIRKIQKEKTVKLVAEVQVKDDAYFCYLNEQWSHIK